MEAIGMGLQAIGKAIGAWATAYAFIYIAGIGTKTFLIYTGKAKMDEMKDQFNFFKKKVHKLFIYEEFQPQIYGHSEVFVVLHKIIQIS